MKYKHPEMFRILSDYRSRCDLLGKLSADASYRLLATEILKMILDQAPMPEREQRYQGIDLFDRQINCIVKISLHLAAASMADDAAAKARIGKLESELSAAAKWHAHTFCDQ